MMDRSNGESSEGIKSVKAAISLYGQKFNGKNQKELPTESGELHLAQLGIRRLNETKNSAEREKSLAESQLLKAKSMVKELSAEIESTNARATARKLELRSPINLQMNGQDQDSELMQELSDTKQNLSRLKLDLVSVSESKARAEKEIEESNSRVRSCMAAIEEISKETEKANEEHALVELARIEAERESREIEAQRRAEASKFSKEIAQAKERLKVLQDEARQAKDLETKAAVTNADLSVLQSEMESVRAMERNIQEAESGGSSSGTVEAELKAAKEELEAIKEEGFQYMSSMDVIRDELILISKETNLLKKQERRADSTVQHLNSKLLKAKSKFESASRAEERTRAIVSNLSSALKEMQLETETANKEKQGIAEETTKTRRKIESTESKILSTEEELQGAARALAAAKTSEAVALRKMKEVAESTMKNRAAAAALSRKSSTITISTTEYEYLTNCAASAQVVADKKVAASRAWIEALKAEEEEVLTRRAIIEKKIRELRAAEEEAEELPEMGEEASIDQRSTTENDTRNEDGDEWLNLEQQARRPRKSVATTRRKSNVRRSSVVLHGVRYHARSPPSFTIKKKTAMPNLVKFLTKRSTITQK